MIENLIYNIDLNRNLKYNILDVGARDCMQSIELYYAFPNSNIYSFECNPNTLDICKKNIENYKVGDRVKLIEGAVCDHNGTIDFYPIDQEKNETIHADGNPGASSMFQHNGNYTSESLAQYKINVNCHRLDHVMKQNGVKNVDIIWMDLQGAELLALKGLGDYLKNVKYIYTEVTYTEIYSGQVMFDELHSFLKDNNFSNLNTPRLTGWQEDILYKNNNLG